MLAKVGEICQFRSEFFPLKNDEIDLTRGAEPIVAAIKEV